METLIWALKTLRIRDYFFKICEHIYANSKCEIVQETVELESLFITSENALIEGRTAKFRTPDFFHIKCNHERCETHCRLNFEKSFSFRSTVSF